MLLILQRISWSFIPARTSAKEMKAIGSSKFITPNPGYPELLNSDGLPLWKAVSQSKMVERSFSTSSSDALPFLSMSIVLEQGMRKKPPRSFIEQILSMPATIGGNFYNKIVNLATGSYFGAQKSNQNPTAKMLPNGAASSFSSAKASPSVLTISSGPYFHAPL